MRVLLVEADAPVAQSIELMLKSDAFNVFVTDQGEEGVQLGQIYDYDAIVLNLVLPDMSGFDVIKQLRVSRIRTPILVISGMSAIDMKVKALGLGADDYVLLPLHKDELVARIKALVRRCRGHAQSVITTGNLTVNIDAKTVSVDGNQIAFTGKEYAMLEALALRKGMTLSKEALLNHLYGGLDEPELKIIDVFICKIRKKLRDAGGHQVETVWGRGYALRDPPRAVDMTAEVASLADDPPTGHVSRMTLRDFKAAQAAEGKVKKGVPVGADV